MENRFLNIILFCFVILSSFIFISTYWINDTFYNVTMDSILFHLSAPLKGSESMVKNYILHISLLVPISMLYIYFKKIVIAKNLNKKLFLILTQVYFLASVFYFTNSVGVIDYILAENNETSFIEDNYARAPSKDIFLGAKRNIVVLALESLENGFTQDSFAETLIPNLQKIQNDNIFIPQLEQTTGTGWTIAALTAMTFGVPLKLPIHGNSYDGNMFKYFMPGAENILHVLSQNKYSVNFILGSDASFSGKKNLFNTHVANANIYDLKYFLEKDNSIRTQGWGITDEQLYSYAKQLISQKIAHASPFFLLVETVDTHNVVPVIEGYPKVYGDSRDTIMHADTMAADFLHWLQQQDFYENTTVIILGDHKLMNKALGEFELKGNRFLYNAIINAPNAANLSFSGRKATMLDLAPIILECAGATLPHGRFGLGVSLFNKEKNLLEKLGAGQLGNELFNKSEFYNSFFKAK